jgi:two-component system, OmpR family, sensor histidine kinase KdpD
VSGMAEDRADVFLQMIRKSQRGRLKVYLGYAAGVGKTYQMLLEAHRVKDEGMDVVVGLVETHGRADTAKLIEGLEVIPRKKIEYRGIILEEMDVDAILKRRPQIVLIDELAHTNVPGSRNPKRYQDVQDILAQGVHVVTTLNVQHVESLYNIVERASGVRVYERLPDSVLAEADQIVNVDVTTEDLDERLKEGKIYPRERIETALSNFFRKSNLEQLRELTLRELASQIDIRSREDIEKLTPATPDQVLVALSSRGPNSEKLLRYASRLSGRLNRNWYAIYVQTPSEEPVVIDAQTQRTLSDTLTLAKQLGAIVFTFKGEDVVKTILQFAKEYRVGHIIMGSPEKLPLWKRMLGQRSISERLEQEAHDITIVVLDTKESDKAPSPQPEESLMEEAPSMPPHLPKEEQRQSLSRLLSPESIIIWDKPVTKEAVICDLTEAAVRAARISKDLDCLEGIQKRERQGSTFFNEAVAFPHARIEGLPYPAVALGLTHGGISDVATEKPIECVFLILTPQDAPDRQVQILGLASRAALDRQLMERLRLEESSVRAFSIIMDWEAV